jgi:deoxyribonuclease V
VDPLEAVALQTQLRSLVRLCALPSPPRLVAGVDVAYSSFDSDGPLAAAVVVLDLASLTVVDSATAAGTSSFPYVPGLLAFRELPFIRTALERLSVVPDVIVCDGYGLAHPRRFGLASHLGVLTGIACFGVGKTAFVGIHAPVDAPRGSSSPLVLDGDVVGAAVRTQAGVKPVYVSPGHLIDLPSAISLTLQLAPSYRLPETTRQADRLSRALLAQMTAQ